MGTFSASKTNCLDRKNDFSLNVGFVFDFVIDLLGFKVQKTWKKLGKNSKIGSKTQKKKEGE